jgi:hypothetical protein
MKQKWVLWLALFLIIILIGLLSYDLFSGKKDSDQNVYEYELDQFKKVDTSALCYKESTQIKLYGQDFHGIAVDKEDNIYAASSNYILKYNNNGDSIFSFKIPDTAHCIAIYPGGKILLGMKNYVEIYTSGGKLINQWKPLNKAAYFTSIATNDSSVFVADAGNKIVHHFDSNGKLLGEIGKKDKGKGIPGFFIPSPYFDVLFDKNGQLWAINTGRHAFEAYTTTGELITRWERSSMNIDGFSGCCNPSHVSILSDGSFVTAEKGIARIKIHEKSGDFKCLVAGPDLFVEGTSGLDLAVDSKDRILVLDPVKNLIRIFKSIR